MLDRRMFATVISFPVLGAACSQAGQPMNPVAPSPTVPQQAFSSRGTWYRGGTAAVNGTLYQNLEAAGLRPEANRLGLVTRLQGRGAPRPASASSHNDDRNGYYFFHINGQHRGSGSATEIVISAGDKWDVFDWNGTN